MFTFSQGKRFSFNHIDFAIRYSKVVNLCKMMGLDGIMVVHGIDGKDNTESIKLTSWLFEGKTGYNIEKFTFLGSEYKELFYIIKADSTAFFYMHENLYQKLEHRIITLPNIKLYVPSEPELEDTDHLQLTKIAQFYQCVEGIDKIGVILSPEDRGKVFSIDKWPLISAYGLAELGKGFFTLTHKPVNIKRAMKILYN